MAARKFLTPIDLTLLEIRNAIAHLLASAPGSPVEGQIYYNTTTHTFSFYNGTAWVVLGTLDQITAPAADVSLNSHKLTNVTDPSSAQDAATRGYLLARTIGDLTAPAADFSMNSHKITNLTTPSTGSDASNKTYVDGQTLNGIATRTASTADITVSGFKITNLGTPTSGTDAATKTYADSLVAGISSWKTAVRAATTATGTLATAFENGDVIDGVTLATGDRILLKNQSTGGENGIYTVAASGAPTRTTDADAGTELVGAAVFVDEGTVNADSSWVNTTNGPITLGTTATVWVQFSGAGQITSGAGLTKTGNTLDVGAGTGISVAADSVAIDTAVTVDKTTAQTLTNKTLTSPVVNSPTGIVKGDVGLGNVDNTSDATKNAASVTLTNKTVDNTNTVTVKDTLFTLQDDGDTSKQARFQASGITTATTRTYTLPDRSDTLVDLGSTQTLAAKTLTSPVLNSPTGLVAADIPALDAAKITTGTMATARQGSGTANSSTFLRGDQTWATPAGGISKVSADCAAATSTVVTHNFGTLDVITQVYVTGTTGAMVDCDVQHTTTNTVTVVFAVAPTAAQYRITCIG